MKVKFVILGKYRKKDGTANIKLYVNNAGGDAYYSTEYDVEDRHFDGMVKPSRQNHIIINSNLIRLRNEAEAICLNNPNLKGVEVIKLIGVTSSGNFIDFFQKYIDDCKAGAYIRARSTISKYEEILRAIKLSPLRTDFDTIGLDWYNKYTGSMRIGGKNENTIANHIKIIKSVLRMALDLGVSKNVEFQKKYFKKPSENTDSIYLTKGEVKKIIDCDLKYLPELQAERDRFVISYYFLLRFGDSLRFQKKDFYADGDIVYLRIRAEKTSREQSVPVSKVAMSILEKYNYELPTIANQDSNFNIKLIGREAKIEDIVSVNGESKPKYKFITTHTARRSMATHLYLDGVDDLTIMSLGGWAKRETMYKYIRVTAFEKAKKASSLEVFK